MNAPDPLTSGRVHLAGLIEAVERWSLLHRFSDRMWDDWDAQIESDYRAGRLDSLIAEVREDIAAGRAEAHA